MSNVITIAIIGGLLIAASFLIYHVVVGILDRSREIFTGVAGGVQVPKYYRWMTLFQIQVPLVLFGGIFSLLMGFTFQEIAKSVAEPSISLLAQACAWMYFVASFAYLTAGPSAIVGLVLILRRSDKVG